MTSAASRGPPRTGSAAAKGPAPVFRPLTFTVQGQAPLDGVTKMLEEFHRANLLQQVRAINIQKSQDRNAARGHARPDDDRRGAPGERGGQAGEPDSRVVFGPAARPGRADAVLRRTGQPQHLHRHAAEVRDSGQTEDSRDVLGFVKLTTVSNTNGRRWEAWLFDQAKRDGESRLRTTVGFNEFSFSDRFDNVLVKAVVVRIDETGVLFKANGRFHHIGLGESLYDALRQPAEAPVPAAGAALGVAWEAPW